MAIRFTNNSEHYTQTVVRNDMNYSSCDFIYKVQTMLDSNFINLLFIYGFVKRLEINGKHIYLWQDSKGNVNYCFSLLDKEYFTTTPVKLGNVLSNHFGCSIEVFNNVNESMKKVTTAAIGLNKALSDSSRHDYHNAYNQQFGTNEDVPEIDYFDNNQQTQSSYSVVAQQLPQHPILNQEQLYKNVIDLSYYQLNYTNGVFYISINELPLVHKEKFSPSQKQAFFLEDNLTVRNKYIPSEYLVNNLPMYNANDSFILMLIFHMARKDTMQAMSILLWLGACFNTLHKQEYALVLHSENDIAMKSFYEEIVAPLMNKEYCEKIVSKDLTEKLLSQQLHEKVIYNFHNITTPQILEEPAQELTNRLIHKDDCKINKKQITTVGNTLITSTSPYIPLISRSVPCKVIKVESNLSNFCSNANIGNNYYQISQYIKDDLGNFASILRSLNLHSLNSPCNLNYYKGDSEILDGDADLLEVFSVFIEYKILGIFETLKMKNPSLYRTLCDDFDKNRVNRKNLILYFTALFGDGIYKPNQNKTLIADLREISSTKEPFDSTKTYNIQGRFYYEL